MEPQSQAFKTWAASEGLQNSATIEQLKDKRIAIDAEDYLLGIISLHPSHEPLLSALGGLPMRFQSRIESDIQNFKDADIEVTFVFNGLDLACHDRTAMLRESSKASRILNQAWKDYDGSNGDQAVGNFAKVCNYRTYHVVRSFYFVLHRLGVFVSVAPYSAAAQIAAFLEDKHVDAVVGSASVLVFGAPKVVTSLDWEKKTFSWVEVKDCLNKTMLSRDHFVDMLLLAGCSILQTFPELETESPGSKIPAVRSAMARVNNNAYSVTAKDEPYQAQFHKARFAVNHPVFTTHGGRIEPKNWQASPNDIHEWIGQRLPQEVYHYLARGIIGPRILNWRSRMEVLELQPLDGGSSNTYQDTVHDKLLPYRAMALALITQSLHRYFQNTEVSLVCWFKPEEKTTLGVRDYTATAQQADTWHVKADTLPQDIKTDPSSMPFSYATTVLSREGIPALTKTPRKSADGQVLKSVTEVQTNTIWRFLSSRGYIDQEHNLSARGKALKAALDRARENGVAGSETDEVIFMALELIRLDLLNSKQLFPHPPYTGAPLRGSDADKGNTMLISRVACLATFNHADIGYTGPLSRHLLAYGQLGAALRGALRDLIEAHACNAMLTGGVTREFSSSEFSDIGAAFPFLTEPNLGLGLVVKSFLDELSNDPDKKQDITKWFSHARDISGDLERTWKIWDAVVAGVNAAEDGVISQEITKDFQSADQWLHEKLEAEQLRQSTKDTNGTSSH